MQNKSFLFVYLIKGFTVLHKHITTPNKWLLQFSEIFPLEDYGENDLGVRKVSPL